MEIEYYMIYLASDNSLYAYTSIKKEYKDFMKFRNKKSFKTKKMILGINEREYLSDEFSICRITPYKFDINNKMTILITHKELLSMTRSIVNAEIFLSSRAFINPCIFKNKYYNMLKILKYINGYNNYANGCAITESLTDDFYIFIHSSMDTVNIDKIYKEMV